MPVYVAQIVQKGPSGTPPLATMAILSASLATAHRWLHSLLPRAPGKVPGRHVGGCAGARVQSGSLPRQAPCRGCCLVASGSLSLTGPRGTLVGLPGKLLLPGPCRLAGTHGASWQVPWNALVGLPGKLLLPGPCLLGLNTLFLNGSKGTTEDLGGHPASLAAGCCNCRAQVRGTRVPLF